MRGLDQDILVTGSPDSLQGRLKPEPLQRAIADFTREFLLAALQRKSTLHAPFSDCLQFEQRRILVFTNIVTILPALLVA